MIFVDSSIWDAAKNERDKNHKRAKEILGEIMKGAHGRPAITDYVIDEVLTWLNVKVGHEVAVEAGRMFFETAQVEVKKVDWGVLKEAYELFRLHGFLSFTDATTVVSMKLSNIETIATFDEDFLKLGFSVVS